MRSGVGGRPRRWPLAPALVALGCGPSFAPVRPSEPIVAVSAPAAAASVRAEVERVLVTDDIPTEGLGEDSALVVELRLANGSPRPFAVSASLMSCLMTIDSGRPGDTLSLTPVGGAPGRFPGELPGEGSLVAPITVAPGETRSYWALFRGYRVADGDVPRRITVRIPTGGGPALELVLADPARGRLRWDLSPPASVWIVGLENVALFGAHLRATGLATVIARRVGLPRRFLLDVGLLSALLVESQGTLRSSTSSFMGLGPNVLLSAPLVTWGPPESPRRLGVFAGGSALLLPEIAHQPVDPTVRPSFYGALVAEGGLAIDVGALRLAPTPFPLSADSPALPRWSIRIGYTHWWVDHGGTDGYLTSFRFVF
jgi:hypothetical protein